MDNTYDSGKIQINEAVISIAANVLLFGLKMWAGIVSGSLALRADAWHTLSDSISSIIVYIGAKVSRIPADKDHPFGHGRAGLIASLFIGFLLIVIGFEFAREGLSNINAHKEANFGTIAIVVTIISIIVKELMAQYAYWGFRKTNDPSLKADGWHHRSDALSSVVLLIGILFGNQFWWADSVLSCIVAGLMIYAAWEIISSGINTLLGEEPDEEILQKLKQYCNEALSCDCCIHHIHVHRYGHHAELTFHIVLDKNLNLNQAHEITDKLEQRIRHDLKMEATIHVDPSK